MKQDDDEEDNDADEAQATTKAVPGILVLVDKNRGLLYLEHSERGSHWHKKCVNLAIREYQETNELITISDDSKYYLFYNNYLMKFSIWFLYDQS